MNISKEKAELILQEEVKAFLSEAHLSRKDHNLAIKKVLEKGVAGVSTEDEASEWLDKAPLSRIQDLDPSLKNVKDISKKERTPGEGVITDTVDDAIKKLIILGDPTGRGGTALRKHTAVIRKFIKTNSQEEKEVVSEQSAALAPDFSKLGDGLLFRIAVDQDPGKAKAVFNILSSTLSSIDDAMDDAGRGDDPDVLIAKCSLTHLMASMELIAQKEKIQLAKNIIPLYKDSLDGFRDGNWNCEDMSGLARGGAGVGGGQEPGEGGEGEEKKEVAPEDKAVPLFKKTPGMKGTQEKPLSSQMMQWGYPQKAVNQILKTVRDQLKANKIEVSEAMIMETFEQIMDEAVRVPGAAKESSEEFDRKFQEIRDQKEKYEKIKNDPNANPRQRKNAERHLAGLELDTKAMVGAFKDWKQRTGGKKGEKERAAAERGAQIGAGGKEELAKDIPVKAGAIKVSAPVAQFGKLYGIEDKDQRRKMAAQVRKWMRRRLKARGYDDNVVSMVKESIDSELLTEKQMLSQLLKDFYPFAKKRLGFDRPPRLFLKDDAANAENVLGKTAHYEPDTESITLYTSGRHPKDIMRSFAHELVHHGQNCRGDLTNFSGEQGYAQQDGHMREMEREAYEQGNLCFRDWEDSIKFGGIVVMSLSENEIREAIRGVVGKLLKENKTILKIDEVEEEVVEEVEEELDEGGMPYNKDDEPEEEEIDPTNDRGALEEAEEIVEEEEEVVEEDEEPLAEAHDKRRCDIYERLMKEWISK